MNLNENEPLFTIYPRKIVIITDEGTELVVDSKPPKKRKVQEEENED